MAWWDKSIVYTVPPTVYCALITQRNCKYKSHKLYQLYSPTSHLHFYIIFFLIFLFFIFNAFTYDVGEKISLWESIVEDSNPRSKPLIWIFTLTFGSNLYRRRELVAAGILKWAEAQRCILIRDDELSCWWANKRLICPWEKISGVTQVRLCEMCRSCNVA